jgi:hypothetical protein
MTLPFTIEQFLGVFRDYNESVWPLQWLLNVVAIAAIVGAIKGGRRASVMVASTLAALWVWMGLGYHMAFFRSINPAAVLFALLFLIQGILIAWFGIVRGQLRYERRLDGPKVIGLVLIAYAMLVYPVMGYVLGHRYPATPTFGVPCPTTIFTFGMLLAAADPRSRVLLVIPAVWSVLGLSAATQLGMWEDVGLVAAAIVTVWVVLSRRSVERRHEVAFGHP